MPLPAGGVGSLPPSFLVNQLIDLMQRQRRDLVAKCAGHPGEELLFCETCDAVFCPICKDGEGLLSQLTVNSANRSRAFA